MKYIEELHYGDFFIYNSIYFLLTTDFKKNNDRLVISLIDGSSHWLKPETIVEKINLYSLDKNNNIIPLKEHKNETKII